MAIIQTTIQGLRTMASASATDVYYTTDIGQEGFWKSSDNAGGVETSVTITDNEGTIITSGWFYPQGGGNPTRPSIGQNVTIFRRAYDGAVNVKWFGAKGDNTANDTNAFQSAINYMISSNAHKGGELFIPAGEYQLEPLVILNASTANFPIRIVGEGRETSILKRRSSSSTEPGLINLKGNNIDSSTQYNMVSFEHFTIEGGGPTGVDVGLYFYYVAWFYVNDVEVFNCGTGVRSIGGLTYNMANFRIHHCRIGCYLSGITFVANSSYANSITLSNGVIADCSEWGIYFEKGSLLTLRGMDMERNGTSSLALSTTSGALYVNNSDTGESAESLVNILDSWFEGNYGETILVEYTQPIPSAPTFATSLNICNSKMFFHEWSGGSNNNDYSRGIDILNARRVTITGSYLVFEKTISGMQRGVNINAGVSTIISSTISYLNDTSSYKTHLNVADYNAAKEQSPSSNNDLNDSGGQGFSEGVRITKGKSLKFANGNPAVVNELAPHTDGGLKFNLSGGSVHSSSDFKAAGNLVSGAGVIDVNGERIERHSSGHGLLLNVTSGGSVNTNTNFVATGNLVSVAGVVDVNGERIERHSSGHGLQFNVTSGGSVHSNSDFKAAGNLVSGAGVVDVNGERIERHSSGHGLLLNVTSGGSVNTNTNFVATGNLVTTSGEVKVLSHTIKHDTTTGDMMMAPEAGHSLRCTSDVLAAGNLSTPGAWNTGKLKLGNYSLWVDSTGHLRIKNGDPTSDTDGNQV